MLGLYTHIPFCKKKCHYCNFVITTSASSSKRRDFLALLEKEILHNGPGFRGRVFDTVYLGGGTPSMLEAEETEEFFRFLKQNLKISPQAEITVECNPGDVDEKKAQAYRKLGVNRISLGVQSFHEASLKRTNRAHGLQEIYESFSVLRKAGFQNISLDLILSLPGEVLEDVRHSLKEVLRLAPEHVSLYELTVEDKTVFGELQKKGTLFLPDESLQMEMLSEARSFLIKNGFKHYELLSYAKHGFESRHNKIYWANGEYLGLGPGAFSYIKGRRYRLSKDVDGYLAKAIADDWSACEEERLSGEKKDVESFLLALRLLDGAEKSRFSGVLPRLRRGIAGLKEKTLLEENERVIRLTPRGEFFAESVFSELSVLE